MSQQPENLGNSGDVPEISQKLKQPAEGAELALDLVPSLEILVKKSGLNPDKLTVALEADGQGNIRVGDKHSIPVTDGTKMTRWDVPALAALFRGDKLPPKDMDHYPPEYVAHFFFIENHVLTLCRGGKDQTDQEMEEIYAALRRRPDGRSLGAAVKCGMRNAECGISKRPEVKSTKSEIRRTEIRMTGRQPTGLTEENGGGRIEDGADV
jgi:hypothetical protein